MKLFVSSRAAECDRERSESFFCVVCFALRSYQRNRVALSRLSPPVQVPSWVWADRNVQLLKRPDISQHAGRTSSSFLILPSEVRPLRLNPGGAKHLRVGRYLQTPYANCDAPGAKAHCIKPWLCALRIPRNEKFCYPSDRIGLVAFFSAAEDVRDRR